MNFVIIKKEIPKYGFAIDDMEDILFLIFGKKGDRLNSLIASKNYEEYRKKLDPALNSWKSITNKQGRTFRD